MNNFGDFISPEEACKQHNETNPDYQKPLSYFKTLAAKNGYCYVCGAEQIWRLVDTGMCFSCTTGEADASDDYELIQRVSQ